MGRPLARKPAFPSWSWACDPRQPWSVAPLGWRSCASVCMCLSLPFSLPLSHSAALCLACLSPQCLPFSFHVLLSSKELPLVLNACHFSKYREAAFCLPSSLPWAGRGCAGPAVWAEQGHLLWSRKGCVGSHRWGGMMITGSDLAWHAGSLQKVWGEDSL